MRSHPRRRLLILLAMVGLGVAAAWAANGFDPRDLGLGALPTAALLLVVVGLGVWLAWRLPAPAATGTDASLIDALPMPGAMLAADGGVVAANPAWTALGADAAAFLAGTTATCPLALPDGTTLLLRRHPLPSGGSLALAFDVTALTASAGEATAAEARWRALFETAPVGIWTLDRSGQTVFANARLAALCGGRQPRSLAGSGLRLAGPGDANALLDLPAGQEAEARLPTAEGGWRSLSISASGWMRRPDGIDVRVLAVLDVSALKTARARIEHLAEHDPLTGLGNRAQFRTALAALAAAREGGALLLLDLDGFRSVNARHGQAAGDTVLRAAAARLLAVVRPDDLVCRLGGDEFAVLAFGATEEGATSIASRIEESLAEALRLAEVALPLSACVGVACAPGHATDPDDLLRAAELALREARQAGTSAIRPFRAEMRLAAEQRETLREALVGAIESGEFHLAYQPQRDMAAQRLVGAEALIRWQSPRLGRAVSPGEMLPLAAEAGLMPQIDAWVLEAALAQIAAWEGVPGAPPLVSINISGVTLRDPGFADRVARGLLQHGLAPAKLEIEIPEDLAVRDLADIEATLERLVALGIRLALDDFGAGHSSLPHVVRLPVHRLKLDRSIVSGLPDDTKARSVLHATMALAQGMNIEVIGEGVETDAQAFALRRAGCQLLQGWLIAKPMPADQLVPPMPHRVRA